MPTVRSRLPLLGLVLFLMAGLLVARPATSEAAVPAGFRDFTVMTGLTTPTTIEFADDGRVFVAEKRGIVKVFDSLTDTTPTVFADLRTNVYNAADRGLLGLALHPDFPDDPSVYLLYTYDGDIGGSAPKYGTGADTDNCPVAQCIVSGRLTRLTASGNTATGAEQVLVHDWCQQYTSHSIGQVAFGPDGALYASAGDGASFSNVDYGQAGNPCGDPPGATGTNLTAPTAQGGALRSQDLRTTGDPLGLDGTIIRIDPKTGAGLADNPLASSADANARRVIAHGLRNPFRFTFRPGTGELITGDVGWNVYEEVNRVADPNDAVIENFGWPCYEGTGRQNGYDGANLDLCEQLYPTNSVTPPLFQWPHSGEAVAGDGCGTGQSSSSGVAFYAGGDYPDAYDGSLFFSDYSRDCIWRIPRDAAGNLVPASASLFVDDASGPVDLTVGPEGDLYYVAIKTGTVHRIGYSAGNQVPFAVATATPTSGAAPLAVQFDGRGSSDPDTGDVLSYSWDLDGNGTFGDATTPNPTRTYSAAGPVTVRLRVTDLFGATDEAAVTVQVGDTAPVPVITTPAAGAVATVGSTVSFSGSATDPQAGTLPASALSWRVDIYHCSSPTSCHQHPGAAAFPGVASGSFTVPEHETTAYLDLVLTATSGGESRSTSRRIDYRTTNLTFASSPPGVPLGVGSGTVTPNPTATRTDYTNNPLSLSAPSTVTIGGVPYAFTNWSDGGPQVGDRRVPAAATTYTAYYRRTDLVAGRTLFRDTFSNMSSSGWTPLTAPRSWSVCAPDANNNGQYCAARVTGNGAITARGDATWGNYSVQAAVRPMEDRGGGAVLGRVQGANAYYQLELRRVNGQKSWTLYRRTPTSWVRLGGGLFDYTIGQPITLRLDMRGTTLTAAASRNGGSSFSTLGTVTDGAYRTGRVGLRAWDTPVRFDTVQVIAR